MPITSLDELLISNEMQLSFVTMDVIQLIENQGIQTFLCELLSQKPELRQQLSDYLTSTAECAIL
jgi:hypothetical protein